MTNIKTLALAAMTVLSLGFATAMAQESAGGVGFGPWETEQLQKALSNMHHGAALTAQQAGSSDVDRARTPTYPDAVLSGGGDEGN